MAEAPARDKKSDTEELERLHKCERQVSYEFKDLTYLSQALTHSSIKTYNNPSNERLEFLGDSVLGLVMTEYLYNFYTDKDEGELTQIKSVVVSTYTQSQCQIRFATRRRCTSFIEEIEGSVMKS